MLEQTLVKFKIRRFLEPTFCYLKPTRFQEEIFPALGADKEDLV